MNKSKLITLENTRQSKILHVRLHTCRGTFRLEFSEVHPLPQGIRCQNLIDLRKSVRRWDLVRQSSYYLNIPNRIHALIKNYEKNVGIFDMINM